MNVTIFNHRWCRTFIAKSEQDKSALTYYKTINEIKRQLVVSFVFEDTRYYSLFPTYVDFAQYQQKFKPEYRSFFELVLKEQRQKPRFDVEVNLAENPEARNVDWNNVLEHLVTSTIEVLKEWGCDPLLERDILLYQSHGRDKNSNHLVVNNYSHGDNDEAKLFYRTVVDRMPEHYREYIDPAVYSSKQQFRIVGSQKQNSGRPKVFMERWNYQGKEIVHEYSDEIDELGDGSEDEQYKILLQLEESLLTVVDSCSPLIVPEELASTDRNILIKRGTLLLDDHQITKEDAVQALEMYASMGKMSFRDQKFPYKMSHIQEGILVLKRIKASKCPICKRAHDRENPYITVGGVDRSVYFHCRRAPQGSSLFVGNLGPSSDEEMKPIVSKFLSKHTCLDDRETVYTNVNIDSIKPKDCHSDLPIANEEDVASHLIDYHQEDMSIRKTPFVLCTPGEKLSKPSSNSLPPDSSSTFPDFVTHTTPIMKHRLPNPPESILREMMSPKFTDNLLIGKSSNVVDVDSRLPSFNERLDNSVQRKHSEIVYVDAIGLSKHDSFYDTRRTGRHNVPHDECARLTSTDDVERIISPSRIMEQTDQCGDRNTECRPIRNIPIFPLDDNTNSTPEFQDPRRSVATSPIKYNGDVSKGSHTIQGPHTGAINHGKNNTITCLPMFGNDPTEITPIMRTFESSQGRQDQESEKLDIRCANEDGRGSQGTPSRMTIGGRTPSRMTIGGRTPLRTSTVTPTGGRTPSRMTIGGRTPLRTSTVTPTMPLENMKSVTNENNPKVIPTTPIRNGENSILSTYGTSSKNTSSASPASPASNYEVPRSGLSTTSLNLSHVGNCNTVFNLCQTPEVPKNPPTPSSSGRQKLLELATTPAGLKPLKRPRLIINADKSILGDLRDDFDW